MDSKEKPRYRTRKTCRRRCRRSSSARPAATPTRQAAVPAGREAPEVLPNDLLLVVGEGLLDLVAWHLEALILRHCSTREVEEEAP